MKRLYSNKKITIDSSNSPITFETTGGGTWEIWDRFIAIDGEKIFHIGNICDTCSFFFEKTSTSDKCLNPDNAIEMLNSGLTNLDDSTIDTLCQIIPKGLYEVTLLNIKPTLTIVGDPNDYFAKEQVNLWSIDPFYGVPHSPKINYFRGQDKDIGNDRKLFEFVIPINPPDKLDRSRIDFYKEKILKGYQPTALSLSILDVKEPAFLPDDDIKPHHTSHWCLAHYLLDGHHKIMAANELNTEITLLSFIASEKGISTYENILELLELLK